MKTILRSLILTLFITPFTLHAKAGETFFIPLPQILTKWKVGGQKEKASSNTTYYILEGETMQTWTQLVHLHFKARKKLECADAVEAMKKEALLNKGVAYKIHSQKENDVTFEKIFPSGLHELVRMVMTEKGLHRIAYTKRDTPFEEIDRNLWLERLAKGKPESFDRRPLDTDREFQ